MKKLLACTLILSLVLMLAIPIPASACDGGAVQSWESCVEKWWDWYKGWWEHIPGLQPTEPEPTEPETTEPEAPALGVPTVTTAKYVHKTPYYGMKAHLEISWEAVEGAESYEVLITKADGETITYTTDGTSLYDTAAKCPRVYIEETSTWASASVQIRAAAGDVYGEWSEAKKIGCDTIHTGGGQA